MSSLSDKASIDVRVSKDRMRAVLHVPAGAEGFDRSFLEMVVKERSIAVTAEVAERLDAFLADYAPGDEAVEVELAVGRPAEHGTHGRLEWVEGFDPTADGEGADEADEPVDFYARSTFVNVEAGDHVATLVPPTPGEDGMDVTGASVPAASGREFKQKIDGALTVEEDGRVVAEAPGVLLYEKHELRLINLLEIRSKVDFSTGNVDFDGSVVVREGVCDRFVVKATGDVSIDGLVEGATLIVGGDLHCRRGMAAKERGQVVVDGAAEANYLNNVRGRVRGDLVVLRELLDCELVVGGGLDVANGAIIGGCTVVTGAVDAKILGSGAGAPTHLVLGEVPFLARRLTRLERIEKAAREVVAARKAKLDELGMGSAVKDERTQRLEADTRADIEAAEKRMKACAARRDVLRRALAQERHVQLKVFKMIHHRTRLSIAGRDFVFEDDVKGPLTITRRESGEIQVRRGDSDPQSIHDVCRETRRAA